MYMPVTPASGGGGGKKEIQRNSELPVQGEILSQDNKMESDRKTISALLWSLDAHAHLACVTHPYTTHTINK